MPLRSAAVLVALALALGAVLPTLAQQALQWVGEGHRMPKAPPAWAIERASPKPGCRYFPETGHNVCGAFLRYWETFGGPTDRDRILRFGYPLTEEYFAPELGQNGVTTQWFERARLELHPPGTIPDRFDVLEGHLAREILAMLTAPATPTPTPPPPGLTLSATQQVFVVGQDPDGGSGVLNGGRDYNNNNNVVAEWTEFIVTARLTGLSPLSGRWVRFVLVPSSGDQIDGSSTAVVKYSLTGATGLAATPVLKFTDPVVSSPGGWVQITACVDQDLDSQCDGGSQFIATMTLYFVKEGTISLLNGGTSGVQNCVTDTNRIRFDCLAQNHRGRDAILRVTLQGAAAATVPLVAVINNATDQAEASFTACTGSPNYNPTSTEQAKQTSFHAASNTHRAEWDIFACKGEANGRFTVQVYWDVNGDGKYTPGVDAQLGSPLQVTIAAN